MLKVDNLSVSYGNIQAVRNISFEVNEGEVVTLIGSNGAGKTTTVNAVMGLLSARGSTGNQMLSKRLATGSSTTDVDE